MPLVRMQPRNNEMVLILERRDSAGRTDEQVKAMRANDPKPPDLAPNDQLYAEQVAAEHAQFPKVMYKAAWKPKLGGDGKPNGEYVLKGDRINPNYPMPYNLAIENGFQGQVTGHGSDKGINIVHPYKTCFVPIGWDQNFPQPIDEMLCRKDMAKLEKDGWVDHPSKLALPQPILEDD